jgi:hypothetical protein
MTMCVLDKYHVMCLLNIQEGREKAHVCQSMDFMCVSDISESIAPLIDPLYIKFIYDIREVLKPLCIKCDLGLVDVRVELRFTQYSLDE